MKLISLRRRASSTALAVALAAPAGCSEEPIVPVVACVAEDMLNGVCIGAPAKVCDDDPCTQDVSCASTIEVFDDAALGAAIGNAGPGSCIVLFPGTYGEAPLPSGVSLLGRGAGAVKLAKVTIPSGTGATVRGVSIGAGGITVAGATGVRVEAVRITGAAAEGAALEAGSSVEFVAVSVEGAGRYGVRIDDGADVTVQRTVVAGSEGPGIWSACAAGCDCVAVPKLTLHDSIVRDNRIAGIALFATEASLRHVDVLRTRPGDKWHYGLGGGGISAAQCSNLTAAAARVHDNKGYGVLVDDSTAALGGPDTSDALEVKNNLFGIWMQSIGQSAPGSVEIDNVSATDNGGVGLGIGGGSVGIIIICKTAVTGTQMVTLPVFEDDMDLGTAKQVGDGIEWIGGAEVNLDQVTLGASARASILIDGAAKGNLSNITLENGDEQKGIVQQNYSGGDQPQIGIGSPPLTASSVELPLPKPPAAVGPL